MDSPLLKIENLTKSFNGVPVLSGVSLELARGRVLGLVGENGAGKSTLAKCVCGLHKPDSGKITLSATCYAIPQEFTLVPTLTVTENIFLGREIHSFGFLRKQEMTRKTRELLKRIAPDLDSERLCSTLSVAEKQKVEIAKALLSDTGVMIMDEPTTVLSRAETERLFAIVREFTSHGGAVIYVSHKLDEVREICDSISVLRDGVLVNTFDSQNVTARKLAEAMVGRELGRSFPPKIIPDENAPEVLRIENFSSDPRVSGVSLCIKRGEIFGLAGLAGAGRTELAETLASLRKRTSGRMFFEGREVFFNSPHEALENGISYLSEDRQGTALLMSEGIMENVTLPSLEMYSRFSFVRDLPRIAAAGRYIAAFGIKCRDAFAPVKSLSGGNQQKAAIARGLDTKPRLFIFDEPTRGVDALARSEIYEFIHDLAQSGVTCILVSSDLDEVIGNCHRIGVMRSGTLSGVLSGTEATEKNIMYLATGATDGQ